MSERNLHPLHHTLRALPHWPAKRRKRFSTPRQGIPCKPNAYGPGTLFLFAHGTCGKPQALPLRLGFHLNCCMRQECLTSRSGPSTRCALLPFSCHWFGSSPRRRGNSRRPRSAWGKPAPHWRRLRAISPSPFTARTCRALNTQHGHWRSYNGQGRMYRPRKWPCNAWHTSCTPRGRKGHRAKRAMAVHRPSPRLTPWTCLLLIAHSRCQSTVEGCGRYEIKTRPPPLETASHPWWEMPTLQPRPQDTAIRAGRIHGSRQMVPNLPRSKIGPPGQKVGQMQPDMSAGGQRGRPTRAFHNATTKPSEHASPSDLLPPSAVSATHVPIPKDHPKPRGNAKGTFPPKKMKQRRSRLGPNSQGDSLTGHEHPPEWEVAEARVAVDAVATAGAIPWMAKHHGNARRLKAHQSPGAALLPTSFLFAYSARFRKFPFTFLCSLCLVTVLATPAMQSIFLILPAQAL